MQNSTKSRVGQNIALHFRSHMSHAPQSQDFRVRRSSRPVKRLLGALLRQAIADFQDNVAAQSRNNKKRFREARDWIFAEAGEGLFSFENICAILGLDPDYLRGGLLLSSARKPTPIVQRLSRSRSNLSGRAIRL